MYTYMTHVNFIIDVWRCEVCDYTFQSRYRYKRHLVSAKHQALANISIDSETEEDNEQNCPTMIDVRDLDIPEVS